MYDIYVTYAMRQITFSKDGHINMYPIPYALLTVWYHVGIPPSGVGFHFLSLNLRGPLLGPIRCGRNNAVSLQRLSHKRRYGFYLVLSKALILGTQPPYFQKNKVTWTGYVYVFWLTAPARPLPDARVNSYSSSQTLNLLAEAPDTEELK